MTDLALQVENVSKMYRLGQVGTGTLSHDLNRLYARLRGRPDPYARVGGENNREEAGGEYVWALRDVSFEVKQGEILGIIGRNGAGKSTLLKLLSRVTAPTTGEIRLNGRVASLLEVGTGFHPELTGRENIYLNGAILGMTRSEISRRFDEIVEFSGCAKYIDTPVKRYSSGMHVRLAFAVAAHLESDILIVDEVLAVGDQEFQNKCIGKMQQMGRESGRTVLFVSHNLTAVRNLCPRSILMNHGQVTFSGETGAVIERYLADAEQTERSLTWDINDNPGAEGLILKSARLTDRTGSTATPLVSSDPFFVEIEYELKQATPNMRVSLSLFNGTGDLILITSDYFFDEHNRRRNPGIFTSILEFPGGMLIAGKYNFSIDIEVPRLRNLIEPQRLFFSIEEQGHSQIGPMNASRIPGIIHPSLTWNIAENRSTDSIAQNKIALHSEGYS